jgi:Terminase-like family.
VTAELEFLEKIKNNDNTEEFELMKRSYIPRVVDEYIPHIPHPTQQLFLSLNYAEEVLYGGAAGGGKSDALLMAALQYVDVPGYNALLLRRTWPDLSLPGAIMDRARTWLSDTDALPRDGGRVWIFPSGARLTFGYLQYDKDKYRYQSAEFQFIGL